MKKALSLILALAMVFTMVPFAFAEGEAAATETNTYNLGEAFAVDYVFTGNPEVDYPSTMPAAIKAEGYTGPWQVGSYSNGSGYDTFSSYSKLHRGHRFARANEDTTYPGLNVPEGLTYSTEPVVAMIWTSNAGVALVDKNTTYWHYEGGAPSTYGDGGYAIADAGGYTGSLGYEFGEGRELKTSSLGYQNGGSVHPAAVFTAPKTGLINPVLKVSANTADTVVFQVYKIDAVTSEKTPIYPAADAVTTSIVTPHESVTVPEKWTSGWQLLSTDLTDYNNGQVWVNEGDQIVMRYAAISQAGANKYFSIDNYQLNYLTSVSTTYAAEYKEETRTVDVSGEIVLPLEGATITVDEALLTKTETAGVYTLTSDYVDGTETTITVVNGATTQTITASFKVMVMDYDLADAYKVTNTFTGTVVENYPNASLNPVYANDGSNMWTVGYYSYASNFNTFSAFARLSRYGMVRRSPQDLTDTTKPTSMTWTNNALIYANPASKYWNAAGSAQVDGDGGYMVSDPNGGIGSIGYNFGSGRKDGSSAVGWNSNSSSINHQAVRFKAPRAGVIMPELKLAASNADRVIYRLDKIAADGTRTRIYPLSTETTVNFSTWASGTTAPEAWVAGWGVVPNYEAGFLHQTNGVVRVEEGEVLELRFAAYNSGNSAYEVDTVIMHYTDAFGPDDELFLDSPMRDYEEETNLTTATPTVDLSRELLNPIAAGTVEYTVTGNEDVLRLTSDPGVYALTGVLNAGGEAAVVTAGYYSPGMSSENGDEPRFTTSTKVYVNAASALVDTFSGYDLLETADTFGYDSFILPYYSDATERAIYGTVDLGIADEWQNATVAFSEDGYFEYLGNGRIRALQSYNFTQAGGTQGSGNGTTVLTNGGGQSLTSKRDEVSMGTPILMTVTAPDGGMRQFGLWSFPTTVQNLAAEGADKNAYTLYPSSNTISNAVMSVEAFTPDGTFLPTYKDPARGDAFTPVVDQQYTDSSNISVRMGSSGDIVLPLSNASYWNSYRSNEPFHGARGISQTFTAPKDGTIDLTGYWPADGYNYSSAKSFMANGTQIVFAVKLYDVDGTELSTLWTQNYGVESADEEAFRLLNTEKNPKVVDTTRVTEGTDDARTLTFDVQKGQKVRVMVSCEINQNYGNYMTLSGTYRPAPVFTYNMDEAEALEGEELFDAENGTAFIYVPGGENITEAGTLVVAYDANGNIVGTATVESTNGAMLVVPDAAYGMIDVEVETTATPSYMKFFLWEDLENIQPLYSDITIR